MQTVAAEASPAQKRPRRTATDAGSQPMDQKVEVLNPSGCALRCRKIYRTRRTPNCWALAAACRLPGPAKGLRRINARAGLKNASCDPNQRRRGHQQLVRGSSGRLLYQHDFDGRLATTGIPENLDCRQAEGRRCSRARRHAGAVGGAPSRWSRVPRHAPALPGQEVGVRQPGRQGWLPKGSRPTKG